MLDNPQLSYRKVAKQVGVSDAAIRYWKKLPLWKKLEDEILLERTEVVKSMIEENREKYKRNLEARQKELEAILSGITAIAAHSTNVSAKSYGQASQNPDPIKACAKLTKAGTHIHGRMAVDAAKAIMAIHEQLYQIGVVFDHVQSLEDEDAED